MEEEEWIACDESAKAMLARALENRQSCLGNLPPFQRVPLRAGNVVEIVGPSASAKSELLIQAAVNCILPKKWKGVRFGGSEGVVMLFDLDCRFDILRLAHTLQCRIHEACGSHYQGYSKTNESSNDELGNEAFLQSPSQQEDELFVACMERFLYIRCYSSFEFLASLKTIRPQLQKHSNGMHLLMIDSISAFYWLDRASKSVSPESTTSRRPLSLQVVLESVVQELRHLLQINTMLVLATKPTIYSMATSKNLANRDGRKWSSKYFSESPNCVNKGSQRNAHREYMPAIWQAFVTHRLLLGRLEDYSTDNRTQKIPIYTSNWETPLVRHMDNFIVQDGGISMVM